MMNRTGKVLAFLLAALTVGTAVVSCGETAETPAKETAGEQNTETVTETEAVTEPAEPTEFEKLPEANYEGETFRTMLYVAEGNYWYDGMTAGKETGELLNDMVYRRNRAVEEKYNVVLDFSIEGNGGSGPLKKEVTAGLQDHDLFVDNKAMLSLAPSGYLYLLDEMPNLDISKPWWDPAATEGLSIHNHTYVVTGDIVPSSLLTTSAMLFNKRLLDSQDIEYPYQLAYDGKWTLDAMISMTKGLTRDLDGDGNYSDSDIFGLTTWHGDSSYSLLFGAGAVFGYKDENDYLVSQPDVEKLTAIYDKMYALLVDNQGQMVNDDAKRAYRNFNNGIAYFCESMLIKIDFNLRDMEDDYGIVPIPKFDEAQETYLSMVSNYGPLVAAPNNPRDAEFTGLMMEALGASSYDTLTPSLYDLIVTSRNVRDEESVDMVNMLIRQRVFDPFYYYEIAGTQFANTMLLAKSRDVVSKLAKYESNAQTKIQKLMNQYAELE